MYWYSDEMKADAASMHLGMVENARRVQIRALAEIAPVIEHLEYWMRLHGYPRRDIFAVRLVLQEAVSNALRHGNGNDPAKHVGIIYVVSPAEVLAEVQDQGAGFSPDDLLNPLAEENRDRPCGRGVFLMRIYSTWVNFNRPGNRVTICRRRTDRR
jgi:serine/threonine-protein kinase RsbW